VTDNTPPIIAIESGLGAPAESQRIAAKLMPLMYQDLRRIARRERSSRANT